MPPLRWPPVVLAVLIGAIVLACSGPPDGWVETRENRTGRYRLHPEGLAPPPESEKDLDFRVGIIEKEIADSGNNIWVEVGQ